MAKKIKLRVSSRVLKKKSRRSVLNSVKRCRFCMDASLKESLDYKNASLLKMFLTECGKLLPSRISGNCASCQRQLVEAVKRSRIMALIPFCSYQ